MCDDVNVFQMRPYELGHCLFLELAAATECHLCLGSNKNLTNK